MSRVYVVLVNWNNWPDTLECLESLLHLDYPDVRVLICDNGSTDCSPERLRAWAAGELDVVPQDPSLHGGQGPARKPIPLGDYGRRAAEQGGQLDDDPPLVLIRSDENLGFAGGNNVCLRYALARGDADYVWLLNNDTVADAGALRALVQRLRDKPQAGMCGSTLLNYRRPHRIDALGGAVYCRWLGLAWHLGRWRRLQRWPAPEEIEGRIDYVVGASMLVPREFLETLGLMDETYFLYYEELDWAIRGRGRYAFAYAPCSLVYHKIGGSIGTASHPLGKSLISDFYTVRNRLKFTRKYYPCSLPSVYLGLLVAIGVRLLLGQWRKASMVCRLMADPDLAFTEFVAGRRDRAA